MSSLSGVSSFMNNLTPEILNALSNYPALAPPPGVIPNFTNPENQNLPFFVITSILFVITTIFYLNRVYSKVFLVRKYYWDDLTSLFAVIGSIAYYVACLWGATKGRLGVHEWDVNVPEAASLNLLIPAYLITVLTPPTFLFMKITFFFMYLSIFKPMRWLRLCAYFGATITAAFYLSMTICQFAFASPRTGETWFSHQATDNEARALSLSVPQSAVGLAIDIYILVLPIVAVTKLHLPTRRKVGIILLFMTGLMACICSLLSIYYRNILNHSSDTTWVLMPVNTVTLLEMFVGIICACTPSAAHTCRHHLPSFEKIKALLSSRFTTLTSRLVGSKHSLSSDVGMEQNETEKMQRQRHYAAIHDGDSMRKKFGHSKSVSTFIRSGTDGDVDPEDGIHLNYEMETTYAQNPV